MPSDFLFDLGDLSAIGSFQRTGDVRELAPVLRHMIQRKHVAEIEAAAAETRRGEAERAERARLDDIRHAEIRAENIRLDAESDAREARLKNAMRFTTPDVSTEEGIEDFFDRI